MIGQIELGESGGVSRCYLYCKMRNPRNMGDTVGYMGAIVRT
jgi:hypothetical protein